MTKPTPDEIAAADSCAKCAVSDQYASVPGGPWISGFPVRALGKCYLHQSAELESARAEVVRLRERVTSLSGAVNCALNNLGDHGQPYVRDARSILERALVVDRRLAAQETKVEEKTTEPYDSSHDPECAACGHVQSDHPRDAYCGATVEDDDGDVRCECSRFACPVAEQPAKAPEAEQAEPQGGVSDEQPVPVSETKNRAYVSWLQSVSDRNAVYTPETFFGGFDAGRAAEAAARSDGLGKAWAAATQWTETATRLRTELDVAERELEAERAAHTETRQELAELRALYNANALKQELERVRAELSVAHTNRDTLLRETAELARKLDRAEAAARQARPEVSDADLALALYASWNMPGDALGLERFDRVAKTAKSALLGVPGRVPTVEAVGRLLVEVTAEPANITDAAERFLALFAGKDQDSSPAVGEADAAVRAAVAPSAGGVAAQPTAGAGLDERPWCREAPPDSEIGQEHELEPVEGFPHGVMTYAGPWVGDSQATGTPIWYRDLATRDGARLWKITIAGWRRAEQPKPEPARLVIVEPGDDLAGMPTALRERLDEIELQARVTRRWIVEVWPHMKPEKALARIEAEERRK